MREDLFKKYVAAKRMELEYRLMGVYYKDDYEHPDSKPAYMFNQYTIILNDIRNDCINYQISAEQIEDIISTLGGLFQYYILKIRGLSVGQGFKDLLENISGGQEIPDYIVKQIDDLFEEDNDNEE